MPENLIYLIDENLPYKFKLWHSMEYIHVKDLSLIHTDEEIWEYAKSKSLTIVTKDTHFSNKILFSTPPPPNYSFKNWKYQIS